MCPSRVITTRVSRATLLLVMGEACAGGQVDLGRADGAAPCIVSSIGTDGSKWNSGFYLSNGHSRGETFVATDTLIQSITVWRSARPDSNLTPMHLFITGVDSVSGYPVTWPILLDGPVLVVPYGDGVHPVPIKFNLDPPFALPHPGRYFFAVKENTCLGFFFTLLADTTDPYPEGQCFFTSANYSCAGLGGSVGINSRFADLIFNIEFCEPAVPTRSATWGNVKSLYR